MSSNLNATNSNSNKNSQNTENFINSSLNSVPSKAYLTNLNSTKISQNNKNSTTSSQHSKTPSIKFTLSLTYHIFRVLAYMLLGVIFGAFGNVLSFLNKGIFFFVLGIFMVLLGLSLNFRGQFLAFFENPFFFNLFAKKMWQRLNFKGYKSAVVLGFCNGFVPCGLVYFYLALAMSQDSLIQSAFIMLVFGACTLPALLFFNEAFSLLQGIFGDRFQVWWTKISYFIIILYGIYLAYLGVSLTR
nr:sulfite exporter TauE/SafE family protein [Campylobacter troglodytis]